MGCLSSKTTESISPSFNLESAQPIVKVDQTEIVKTKRQLQSLIKKEPTSQSLVDLIQKVSVKGLFQCKFVGLHYIHNYLMQIREKSIDKNSVLILDIRSE